MYKKQTAKTQKDSLDGYFQCQRTEMIKYVPKSSRKILDIGCGSGSFGENLKESYCTEIWGIEPSEAAAKVAGTKLDKVICASFSEELALPNNYFDCIILNDVLEHFIDPFSSLHCCHKLLAPSGVIVASIPNVRYFDNIWDLLIHGNWEYKDSGILDRTHLRFFTRKSIISTFESLNFLVTCVEGINPLEKVNSHHTKMFRCLRFLVGEAIEDMRYLQFAVVARVEHKYKA